jgi:octaprenyl-diphosphate synthase
VILSVRQGSDEERAFWTRTLVHGRIEAEDFDIALAAMRRYGAIEATLDRARHYGTRAREALAILPQGPGTRALSEVVDFCINRAS